MILAAIALSFAPAAPAQPQDAPPPPAAGSSDSAPPEGAPDDAQRWSILADPCRSERRSDGEEILVCGNEVAARLPLPEERGPPDRPMPSNPDMNGMGALGAASAPCATLSSGCTVGIDLFGAATALVRLAGKLVDPDSCCERPGEGTSAGMLVGDTVSAVAGVFRGKEEVSGERVPIDLDAPPPDSASVPILP